MTDGLPKLFTFYGKIELNFSIGPSFYLKIVMQSLEGSYVSKMIYYMPCENCEKHPDYPDVEPLTLHQDTICVVCGCPSIG